MPLPFSNLSLNTFLNAQWAFNSNWTIPKWTHHFLNYIHFLILWAPEGIFSSFHPSFPLCNQWLSCRTVSETAPQFTQYVLHTVHQISASAWLLTSEKSISKMITPLIEKFWWPQGLLILSAVKFHSFLRPLWNFLQYSNHTEAFSHFSWVMHITLPLFYLCW